MPSRFSTFYLSLSRSRPEFPEGNGQGLTEEESLESLRESILLLIDDRREDARASLGTGEKLIPLALG